MASVKVLWDERLFSSRKVSALVRAVLIFWKQEQRVPRFVRPQPINECEPPPGGHHRGAGKTKDGKKNVLMGADGVLLAQIPLGEGACPNRVKPFAPGFSSPETFSPVASASHSECSPREGEVRPRLSSLRLGRAGADSQFQTEFY